MQNLSEMFNINYFIVSQTNPWIVPFLNHSEHHRHSKRTFFYKAYEKIKDLIAAELKHRVNQFAIMGILPSAITRYFNLITQQYSGHVTIWPLVTVQDYVHILDNPSTELLRNCIINGSRRVYPSNKKAYLNLIIIIEVNRITANLVVERALERNYLKARSSSDRPMLLAEVIESDYDNRFASFLRIYFLNRIGKISR